MKGYMKSECFHLTCVMFITLLCDATTVPAKEISDEAVERISREALNDLSKVQSSKTPDWMSVLKNNISNLDARKADREDVKNGRILPKRWFIDEANRVNNSMYALENLLTGKYLSQNEEEFRNLLMTFHSIGELIQNESTELFEWLSNRVDQLPPSKGDVVIYFAFYEGSSFDKCSKEFWHASAASWKKMLTAKNPVYRLIALERAGYFEKDRKNLLQTYERGLKEQNTIFQSVALSGLRQLGGKEAKEMIEDFLKGKPVENDGTLDPEGNIREDAKDVLSAISKK